MCPRAFYAFCVFPRALSVTDTVGLECGAGVRVTQVKSGRGTHLPALRFQGTRLLGQEEVRDGQRSPSRRFPAHRAPWDRPPSAPPAEPLWDPVWEPPPGHGVASKPQTAAQRV